MRKLKKSLAVLLAVLMLASFMPLFASAATITLNSTNIIVLEAPKISYGDQIEVSKITAKYGITPKDLTVTGGKLGYIASEGAEPVVIPGTFSGSSTLKIGASENANIRLKFTPDDTTTYSSPTVSNLYDMAEGVVWPSAHIIALQTTLSEKPVLSTTTIGINNYLSAISVSGGKVIDENGNEVTNGSWSFVNNRLMDTEGTFEEEIQWKRTGYETIKLTVTITVKEFKATLAEAPVISSLSTGSHINKTKISDGKVVDESGNEITGGKWTFDKSTLNYLYCDTTVKATWKKTGYTTITTDVVIPVTQNDATYTFEKAATTDVSGQTLTYAPELTWDSIKINEAIVKDKNGNIIEGTYTLNYLPSPKALFTGRIGVYKDGVIVYICFTPKDTSLPVYYFNDMITVIPADFTVSEDSELVFNYGTEYKTSYSEYNNDLRFSTIKTIPEEAGSQGIKYVKWAQEDFDPSTADYGTVAMVEVTIIPEHGGYNNATVTMPIRIQPYTILGNFNSESQNGVRECVAFVSNGDEADGLITYKLEFTNKRLNGSVIITATDGTNNYDIATVIPDENNRFFIEDKWQAPADGNYVFTFTYVASENDTAVFTDENNKVIVSKDIPVDMKEFRTLTIKVGSTVITEKVREGSGFVKIWSDITAADKSILDHWVVTDANGKEIELTTNTYRPFDSTAPTLNLIMPECDITITAMSAQGEEVTDNSGGIFGSLWSFWQKLVDFIVEIYRTIVDFFVPAMEQV